jgi:hypothetical protein
MFEVEQARDFETLYVARMPFTEYRPRCAVDLVFQSFAVEGVGLPESYSPPRGTIPVAWRDRIVAGCVALHPHMPLHAKFGGRIGLSGLGGGPVARPLNRKLEVCSPPGRLPRGGIPVMKTAIIAAITLSMLQGAPVRPKVTVDNLSWLQGCWEGGSGSTQISEQWMAPAGGTMLAMSRTVAGTRTVAFEFIRVWQDAAGDIYFTARPSGQPEATFKMVRAGFREVVFENPEHDFPQRIIYRLARDGELAARIEGRRDGTSEGIDFALRRARCVGD